MADDKGTSQLFGESLPGTGGDYIDTNDVEGHMTNKHTTPTPLGADGGDGSPEGFNNKPLYQGVDGTDTEGHRSDEAGPEGFNNKPLYQGVDGGPEGFNNKPLYQGIDGSDTEGHRTGDGGEAGPEGFNNKPLYQGADGGPQGFNNKPLYQGIDGADEDVEGHGFAKRAPGENPHGDR